MNIEFRVDHRVNNGVDDDQEPHDEQEQGNKGRPYDRKRKNPLAFRGVMTLIMEFWSGSQESVSAAISYLWMKKAHSKFLTLFEILT